MENGIKATSQICSCYNGSSDNQTPRTPASLAGTSPTYSSVALTWMAFTDNVGVTGYNVYQNGTLVAISTTNSCTVTGLKASTACPFTVKAVDAVGNQSAAQGGLVGFFF